MDLKSPPSPLAALYLKEIGLFAVLNQEPPPENALALMKKAEDAAAYVEKQFEALKASKGTKALNKKFKVMRLAAKAQDKPGVTYDQFIADFKASIMVAFCKNLIARRRNTSL